MGWRQVEPQRRKREIPTNRLVFYPSTKKNIGKIPRLRLSLYIAAAAKV
jgi:hypothetical protein